MKKLVIFDLDGTLLNTIADLADATNYALAKNGFPTHEEDKYKYFVGNGADMLIQRALPEGTSKEVFDEVRKDFISQYTTHASVKTAPYPGIVEMLKTLESKGIKMAVASNKPHRETEKVVAHYFPDIHFQLVFGHRAGYNPKPDPQIVFDILSELKIEKHDTLYVGDSSVDMQTAKAGGLYGIGCSWGFRTKEELLENGADAIIDSPEELIPFLMK